MRRVLLVLALASAASTSFVSVAVSAPQDAPARAVSMPPPAYPAEARREGIEGTVVIEFVIDETGTVRKPMVVESVTGLDEAALKTVETWRFEPARQKGQPVATRARAPVKFELDEEARAAAAARNTDHIPLELSSPPPGFVLEEAVAFGEGEEKIPVVRAYDRPCDVVDLAGPAHRVARTVRKAGEDGKDLDAGTIRVQAAATLTVYHRRLDHVLRSQHSSTNTCRLQVPSRVVLVGKDGGELASLGKVRFNRRKEDKRVQGAGVVAVAVFDWAKALTLSGDGDELTVVVEFLNDKKPARIEFDEKKLRDLAPDWAWADSGVPEK